MERQARRAQKAQSEALNIANADSQHPSLFGALPMGYVPPYNGYGYQVGFPFLSGAIFEFQKDIFWES